MISSLFKIDGKIPIVQIILGILIGIAGTLIYVRFYKPMFLDSELPLLPEIPEIAQQGGMTYTQKNVDNVQIKDEVTLVPPEDLPKIQLQEIDDEEEEEEED